MVSATPCYPLRALSYELFWLASFTSVLIQLPPNEEMDKKRKGAETSVEGLLPMPEDDEN